MRMPTADKLANDAADRVQRRRRGMFFLAIVALCSVIAYLTCPRVGDAPLDITARKIEIDGEPYILINATNLDSMSSLSVVRILHDGGDALRIDIASAPLIAGAPIISRFPQLHPAGGLDFPCRILARRDGEYREVAVIR